MHDRLRDMGRDIAKSTQRPRLRRRNDNENDRSNFLELIKRPSEDALLEMVGSRIINELFSYPEGSEYKTHVLQFLVVDGDCTTQKFVKLLWLKWWNCSYKRIPSFLSMENLRVLEIEGSSSLEELWDDRTSQAPLHLREPHVTDCPKFRKIPKSIGSLKNLEKLVLRSPHVLGPGLEMGLPDEFCCLRSLKHLELCCYRDLKSLPNRFGDLTNLQHLDLSRCSKLQVLPNSFSQLTQLQYLSLEYCSRLIVSQAMFGNISTLEHVDFRGCDNLKVLAIAIDRQRYLRTLYFRCNQLPAEIGELRNLEVLEVGGQFLTMLPSSLGNLCRLKKLKLSQCERLSCLPESVGLLKRPETLDISYSGLDRLPEAVAQLNNLQKLYIYHSPIRKMTLRRSELSDEKCMFRLKDVVLIYTKTTFISISEDVRPSLQTLVIQECRKLKEVELALPTTLVSLEINNCRILKTITGLSDLPKLRRLDISRCAEVEKLPNLARLTSLNKLVAKRCGKLQNVEGVGQMSSLKVLNADGCWNLQSVEGLGRLQGIESLASLIRQVD